MLVDKLLILPLDILMTFKEFLIMESGGDSGSDFFYGLQLLPSDAFDFTPASSFPAELQLLKNRWKTEKEQGRKFTNIDYDKFQGLGFTSVESSDAPGTNPGFWRHRPDRGSSLKVNHHQKLQSIGIGKNSKAELLAKCNKIFDIDLNQIFGDKGTGTSPILPKDFDKPFRRVYENLVPYDVVIRMPTNTDMGIHSKYIGPDETGEKDPEEEIPMADFGFEKKPKKARKKFQRKA